ncbi:MAG TPA: hypothetical protein VGL35_06915 [Rhizomicrobium sp.]
MQTENKIHFALGVLTAAIGTLPLLSVFGVLPSRPPAPSDAPAWLGGAIGLTFFLGGVAVIVRSFSSADDSSGDLPATAPRAVRRAYEVLMMLIPILLAVMLSWVAFGPGERQFVISGGSGGAAAAMSSSGGHQIIGRVAFGFGAVLGWFIAGYTVLILLRRWFPRR